MAQDEDEDSKKDRDENAGGRWDVSATENVVYLERFSEDDEKTFGDVLTPQDARGLAELLNKFADKAEHAESDDGSEESEDDGDSKGADDSEQPEPEGGDNASDSDKSQEKSDTSEDSK